MLTEVQLLVSEGSHPSTGTRAPSPRPQLCCSLLPTCHPTLHLHCILPLTPLQCKYCSRPHLLSHVALGLLPR
jgi:hypothetical protein